MSEYETACDDQMPSGYSLANFNAVSFSKKHLPQCIETTRESVSDSTVVEKTSELEYITG
jgi:hypothetical protein